MKQESELFENVVKAIHGGIALYHYENGGFVPHYVSSGVSALLGMTVDEYLEQYANNIGKSIYELDRSLVLSAVQNTMENNKISSVSYRSPYKGGGHVWINAVFSRQTNEEGKPELHAIFTSASQQFENQLKILDSTTVGVYIIDEETYEVYYCNQGGFQLFGRDVTDVVGRKCYELFHHRDTPCEYCILHKAKALQNEKPQVVFDTDRAKWLSIYAKSSIWNDRPAVIQYVTDVSELKEATDKLRRNEQITEAASDFAGIWMWMYDIKKRQAYCYRKLQQDFGVPAVIDNYPHEWLKMGFIVPEDEELYREQVEQICAGKKEVMFQCRIRTKDGLVHWIRCHLNRLVEENLDEEIAVGTLQIIDSEKDLEKRIEIEQKKPFANQDTLLFVGIANISSNKMISYQWFKSELVKQKIPETFDVAASIPLEFIVEDSVKDMFGKQHCREQIEEDYKLGNTSNSAEFQCRFLNGDVMWVKNTQDILLDPQNGDLYLYEYVYDIDAKKKDQLAIDTLFAEEMEFTVRINVRSGIGHLVMAKNHEEAKAYETDYDYRESIKTLIAERVYPGDAKMMKEIVNLPSLVQKLEKEKSVTVTYRRVSESGRVLHKKICAFYLDETHQDIILARRDITDIYEEEEQHKAELERAVVAANAANKAKSTFLAQMSHEIRTPMNAIMGMTKLAEDVSDNKEVREYLHKIDVSSKYLLGILNDVLDMSRIESGKLILRPEWCQAGEIIQSCINMVIPTTEEKGIRFIYPKICSHPEIELLVDPLRTKQILMNLLNNAMKFTPEGGTITLRMDNKLHDNGVGVDVIYVQDTGCGMSDEFLERIFQPFEQERNPFSNKVQGTGLGLAFVKEIVEAMGGEVTASSVLNQGSIFSIQIPYQYRMTDQTRKKEKKPVPYMGHLAGKRILLVDDHPLNREIAKKILEKESMQVELAVDGKAAVTCFEDSAPGYYDAILMDIRMPVMNGLEASKAIRAMRRTDALGIPIIAMTANAFDEDVKKSLGAGMNAHLAKPIEPKALYETLAEFL